MLPNFRYHPDPIATGNVKASDTVCKCCRQARGYVYSGQIYGPDSLRDRLCPWCIADGSAAKKFDAMFSYYRPLAEAGLPSDIVDEISTRTPGYICWQEETWLLCCDDACEFHGDAPAAELKALRGDALARVLTELKCREQHWQDLLECYRPGGDPAVYKFICRHCHEVKYGMDFS
jgi:uncharacterized protein CbrC (UPF0167 family)